MANLIGQRQDLCRKNRAITGMVVDFIFVLFESFVVFLCRSSLIVLQWAHPHNTMKDTKSRRNQRSKRVFRGLPAHFSQFVAVFSKIILHGVVNSPQPFSESEIFNRAKQI